MPIRPDFKHTAEPQKTGKRRIGPIRLALLLSLSAVVAFFIGNAPQGPSRDDPLEKPMAATRRASASLSAAAASYSSMAGKAVRAT